MATFENIASLYGGGVTFSEHRYLHFVKSPEILKPSGQESLLLMPAYSFYG